MWQQTETGLTKTWVFADFAAAWVFAEKIAALAEAHNHHPEITVGWGKVTVSGLCTHDAGGAITAKDHALAEAIDALALADGI